MTVLYDYEVCERVVATMISWLHIYKKFLKFEIYLLNCYVFR